MQAEEKKVLEGEKVLKTMEKIKRTSVDVSINPKQSMLDFTKEELKKLEDIDIVTLSKEEASLVGLAKKNYSENIAGYEVAKLEGVMVPLKYRDLQVVKDGVLEALKYSREFNFDDDIKMKAMIRQEHTLTVYLALRKKDDKTKRFYNTLEDIAIETESTIEKLYNIYCDNFVLTDEERKNS